MASNCRIQVEGYTYFITNLTYRRQRFLSDNIDLFWNAVEAAKQKTLFDMTAWVILPDHFHLLIYFDKGNISNIMKGIKLAFSAHFRKRQGLTAGRTWQNGFWDHIIRTEEDLKRHLDYIHFNPVKHGLVRRAVDYPYSSIHLFKEFYPEDWGIAASDKPEGDFRE
jgi:putative transposase